MTVMLASPIKPDYIQRLRETMEVFCYIPRHSNSLITVSNLLGSAGYSVAEAALSGCAVGQFSIPCACTFDGFCSFNSCSLPFSLAVGSLP